ncbi:MAG: hypothetical protein HKN08_04415 [Gammaproteobacteria bacterium]|nr:hypothetical protein [Gammaproteobacteria bacterium]
MHSCLTNKETVYYPLVFDLVDLLTLTDTEETPGYQARFKVNELEKRDDGMDPKLFAETSRWLGLKFMVDAKNLLNTAETRNRQIYKQLRGLSPLNREEIRLYAKGREIELTVSGTF